jgi:MFS family permease
MASCSAAILTPAFPLIQSAWKLSNTQLQAIVSIFLLAYLLGQWIYGPLANRFGRISALKIGFSINLLGIILSFAAAHFDSYAGLLWGRFITAFGASAGLVCTFVLLNEYFEPKQSKALFPFVVLSFTLGIGLATWIGGIVTTHFGWSFNFLVLFIQGIFSLLMLRGFPETLKASKSIHPLEILKSYGVALRSRTLVTYALWVGFVSAFSYGYSVVAPMLSQSWFDLSPTAYGNYSLLNMLGMFAGSFLAIPLLKKASNRQIIVFSSAMMAILLLGVLFLHRVHHLGPVIFFLASSLCYALSSFIFPAASHAASNAIPDKAQASGAMNGLNLGLAVIALILIGLLPFGFFGNFLVILVGIGLLGTGLIFKL